MKRVIKKSSQLDNVLSFLWAVVIIVGCTYLVFWKGVSAWWYVLALALLNVDVYYYKETIEE